MKKKNIISTILIIIVLMIVVTIFLAFSKSDYRKNNSNEISYKNLMGILGDSIKNKGIVEINEDEINSLAEIFLKENVKKENITLNGVSVEFLDNNIVLHAYVEYKKMNVLLSTKGQIDVKGDYIMYAPNNFKIGKLNLPKRFVMNKLKEKINSDKLKIDDDFISAKSDVFLVKIDDIKIQDKKIIVSSKEAYDQFQKLQKLSNKKSISEYAEKINESSKNEEDKDSTIEKNISSNTKENNNHIESNLKNYSDNNYKEKNNDNQSVEKLPNSKKEIEKTGNFNKDDTNSDSQENTGDTIEVNDNNKKVEASIGQDKNHSINNNEKDRNDKKSSEEVNENNTSEKLEEKPGEEQSDEKLSDQEKAEYSLKIMRNDLSKVRGLVKSSEEKQIIDIMYSTVNKLMVDQNYNFWGDAGTVLSIYNSFTNEKKEAFKKIVFSNVNMDNAFELNNMFQ